MSATDADLPAQPDPSPSTVVPKGPRRLLFSIYHFLGMPARLSYRLVRNAFEEHPYALYDAFWFYLVKDFVEYFAWVPTQGRGTTRAPMSEEQRSGFLQKHGAAWTLLPRIDAAKLKGHPVLSKWPAQLAQPYRARAATLLPVEGYWIGDRMQLSQQQARTGEKVVLYLHSGYYLMGTGDPTNEAAPTPRDLLAALQTKAKSTSTSSAAKIPTSLLSVEYRKAGTASWPAPLLDAITAWHYLVDELHFAPNDIVIVGESAGSHLTLSLTRYLIEQARASAPEGIAPPAQLPAANILLAPWADLTGSLNSHRPDYARLQPRCWLPPSMAQQSRESLLPGLESMPETHVQSVWLSPAAEFDKLYDTDGSEVKREEIFRGWPRTCLVYSTNDMLLPNPLNLYDRMKAARGGSSGGSDADRPRASIAKSKASEESSDEEDSKDPDDVAQQSRTHNLKYALQGLGHVEGDKDLTRVVLDNVPHAPWTLLPGVFARARKESLDAAAEWLALSWE